MQIKIDNNDYPMFISIYQTIKFSNQLNFTVMKNLWIAVVMLLLLTTCTQDGSDLPGVGKVTFKSIVVDSFSGNLPNGRIAGPSSWKHVFLPWVEMIITNKATGVEHSMFYNPNDFGEGFSISLPYGSYRFISEYQAGEISLYLPFKVEGEFNLGISSIEISMSGITDYGLVTLKKDFVNEAFKCIGVKIKWSGEGVKEVGTNSKTKEILVKIDKYYFRPTEVNELRGDASKARKNLKWRPETSFKRLVKEMVTKDIQKIEKK